MLRAVQKSPERLEALERIEAWTRARFGLAGDAQVHAWEIACAVPGCPPVETLVVFWIAEQRYQLKVFKPLVEVVADDLPPAWFKGALAVTGEFECGCC
jgi:hypothetical protein